MVTQEQLFLIGNDLINELVKVAPVDTGALRLSIINGLKINTDGTIEISMKEYAKFIEFGTPPHIIRAKDKQVLSDINSPSGKKKNAIYGRSVLHPGTQPNPFIRFVMKTKLPIILKRRLESGNPRQN